MGPDGVFVCRLFVSGEPGMSNRNVYAEPREKGRQAFTVPVTSGNYANERLTFGVVGTGTREVSFQEFTSLVEGPIVPGATVELWLPRMVDASKPASAFTDADYTNSGVTPQTTAGLQRWQVSGYPGGQFRVKSGGTPGTVNVSATAF